MGLHGQDRQDGISQENKEAKSFNEGLAAVGVGGEWGYIDKTGQMVIAPQDDEAYPFSDGLANVELGKKVGYIDKTGKYVWAPTK